MKRAMATFVMVLVSSVALALPSPKDVDAAVKAGQLSQAETMLREVVKEKPNNARAHYELGEVLAREGRPQEGRQEALEAQRLDPSLKFTNDPQRFRDFLAKTATASSPTLSVQPAAGATRPHVSQPAAPAASSFPWGYVLLGGGVLIVIWMVLSRATSAPRPYAPAAGGTGYGGGGYGGGPGYGQGYGVPPQNTGSGVGGAVLGGIAGMAAGYGLAKVLEHGNDEPAQRRAADDGFVPIDSPPQADYGEFDSGAGGDSWDSGDSSSSDDNNW